SELKEMVIEGTRSLLVQPIMRAPSLSSSQTKKSKGFLLLASSIDYAYTDKDKAWIAAIANKFSDLPPAIAVSERSLMMLICCWNWHIFY
ncbi:UNVERIFIED_CONTAM: protein COFACTOR ASSEMBLY OF COMPLEX C SUBUNIT B CCB2, chloroplastic, partial [Sesamum angustifolium]